MNHKKFISKVKVRYAETDQMGVVHHANYPVYMELARTEWLDSLGFSYKKMEDDGIILPVFNLNIDYKKNAKYNDELYIVTQLKSFTGVRIEFVYTITNYHKETVALGTTTLAFVNRESGKPMRCPKPIFDALS